MLVGWVKRTTVGGRIGKRGDDRNYGWTCPRHSRKGAGVGQRDNRSGVGPWDKTKGGGASKPKEIQALR